MNVLDYIAHETERQSGTIREALGMYGAWRYAQNTRHEGYRLNEQALLYMVKCINGITEYRRVPAVFNQGAPAISHDSVPAAMRALGVALSNPSALEPEIRNGYTVGFDIPSLLTKEFLEIHPFADGNGRVASILWNFLRDTLDDPEPMPYFFGEN